MAASKFTVTFMARLGHVYHFCGAQFVQGPFLPFYFLFFFCLIFNSFGERHPVCLLCSACIAAHALGGGEMNNVTFP